MQTLKNILLATSLICSGNLLSQDIHFSQFYNVPMFFNPASTGNFDGDWQASAGYRNQWKSIAQPFRTLGVSYERQFYIHNQHLSGGVYILNDNSGDIALKSNQFVLSGAYHRTVNNNRLHGGFQVGYVHKAVDFRDITFPGQFDPVTGKFNSTLPSGVEDGDRLSYLDVNFGLLWQKKIGRFMPEAGVSMYHLNRPKESFYGEDIRLPAKMAVQAGIKYDISPNLFITPRLFLLNQAKAKDYIAGANAGMTLSPNTSGVREVNAGVFVRTTIANNTDAVIVMASATVRNIQIGISYDLNISSLNTYSNSRGAFEITLVYRSLSTVLNTFTIPCDRY